MLRNRIHMTTITCILVCLLVCMGIPAFAQVAIDWHSVDGGGACPPTASIGGTFELSGTIGQHDAGSFTQPMAGGTYTLVGGFWVVAGSTPSPACACPGDMNIDGVRDGRDIQDFAACLIAGGNCDCAELDESPGLTSADVIVFIGDLLNDAECP